MTSIGIGHFVNLSVISLFDYIKNRISHICFERKKNRCKIEFTNILKCLELKEVAFLCTVLAEENRFFVHSKPDSRLIRNFLKSRIIEQTVPNEFVIPEEVWDLLHSLEEFHDYDESYFRYRCLEDSDDFYTVEQLPTKHPSVEAKLGKIPF